MLSSVADSVGAKQVHDPSNDSDVRDPSRRRTLKALAASVLVPACASPSSQTDPSYLERLRRLEASAGGRLGVCVQRANGGDLLTHRGAERFGMCSTFKLPLAALILREADQGNLSLQDFVPYTGDDMLPHAPVTTEHLEDGGMTIDALAEAAQTTSDNPAANLLLRLIDGPQGFTRRLRTAGDSVTRLDRYELELNYVPKGEVRDTTTPCAMAATVNNFVFGSALLPSSRERLQHWMRETRTGARRIRAGVPSRWIVGNKTGTGIAEGMANKYNDVAVVWPPDAEPVIVAAYYEADGEYDDIRALDEAVLAEVGSIVAAWVVAQS